MKSKYFGFSIPEMLVTMVVLGVLMVLTLPVFMPNKEDKTGIDKDAFACAVTQKAASLNFTSGNFFNTLSLSSTECQRSITNCIYNRGKSCTTFKHYFLNGDNASKEASRKVLKATCDLGGTTACKYMVENVCAPNSSNCDIADSDIDLNFYLVQKLGNNNSGLMSIFDFVNYYYKQNNANIKTAVDAACPYCQNRTACSIRYDDCGWIKEVKSSTSETFDFMKVMNSSQIQVDSEGNAYGFFGTNSSYPIILKFNKKGVLVFSKKINDAFLGTMSCNKNLLLSKNGRFLYLIYPKSSGINILKLSSSGKIVDEKRFTIPSSTINYINVEEDQNNNIVISYTDSFDFKVIKLNNNLEKIFFKSYNVNAYAWPQSGDLWWSDNMDIDSNSNIYIANAILKFLPNHYVYLMIFKLGTDGSLTWYTYYTMNDTATDKEFKPYGLKIYNDIAYISAGYTSSSHKFTALYNINDLSSKTLTPITVLDSYTESWLDLSSFLNEIDSQGNFYLNFKDDYRKLSFDLTSTDLQDHALFQKDDPLNSNKMYYSLVNNLNKSAIIGRVAKTQKATTPFSQTAIPLTLMQDALPAPSITDVNFSSITDPGVTISDFTVSTSDPDYPDIIR